VWTRDGNEEILGDFYGRQGILLQTQQRYVCKKMPPHNVKSGKITR
jgi:hypothetical protein